MNSQRGDANSVWWRWTPPSDGILGFHSTQVHPPIHLSTWHANYPIHADPLPESGIRWGYVRVHAHEDVLIRVTSGSSRPGPFEFLLDFLSDTPPENNTLTHRRVLAGEHFEFQAHTYSATREFGEPSHHASYTGHSVWYEWTATQPGILELHQGSFFPIQGLILAVYQGETFENMEWIGSNHLGITGSFLAVPVEPGTYLIAAASGGGGANFELEGIFIPSGESIAPSLGFEGTLGEPLALRIPSLPPGHWILESGQRLGEWLPMKAVSAGERIEILPLLGDDYHNSTFFRLRRESAE